MVRGGSRAPARSRASGFVLWHDWDEPISIKKVRLLGWCGKDMPAVRFSLHDPLQPCLDGVDSPIDVQRIALWNYTMPDSAVSALGGPNVNISQ